MLNYFFCYGTYSYYFALPAGVLSAPHTSDSWRFRDLLHKVTKCTKFIHMLWYSCVVLNVGQIALWPSCNFCV